MTIAHQLNEFVESEAFTQLFNDLRDKYLREFETSTLSDHAGRHNAYVMLKAARDLKVEIERYVNDLKIKTKLQRN